MANTDHVETLYFDVLKQLSVLDPAVGSGAFLFSSEDVLLDIYLHAIEYFQQLYEEQPLDVSGRIRDELDAIDAAGSKTLYAKREIILNNLYGVDIDEGAVEICKLRLWLSMVADIENDPSKVDPLPNIDFNIRQGDSLIGFNSDEVVVGDQKLLLTQFLQDELTKYREKIQQYRASSGNVGDLRLEIENLHDDLQSKLNDWYAQLPDITIEENIDDPDDVLSTLRAANGQEVKLKFRFSDQISNKIDQKLNEIGFRTWKTAANLELESSDLRSDRIQAAFNMLC